MFCQKQNYAIDTYIRTWVIESAVKSILENDILLYFVNLAISLTILSYEGCKIGIPILDFDEFIPAKFDQRKNITPLSIF